MWQRARRVCVVVFFALIFVTQAGTVSGQDPLFTLFEPEATELSWTNAYLLSVASELAYRTKVRDLPGETYREKFQHRFEPYGLDVLLFLSQDDGPTDTQALMLWRDDLVVVVFSGSEASFEGVFKDWLGTNTKVDLVPFLGHPGVSVHRGFQEALDAVYLDLAEVTRLATESGRQVWLTGHSLGGSLAAMTGVRLATEGIPVGGVYTFASPKIGNQAWVELLDGTLGDRVHHFVSHDDPVPRGPFGRAGEAYAVHENTHVLRADDDPLLESVLPDDPISAKGHGMMGYVNQVYYALPPEAKVRIAAPPPVCGVTSRPVGLHPANELPLCKIPGSPRISREKCLESGAEIVDGVWCAVFQDEDGRYLVRTLWSSDQER